MSLEQTIRKTVMAESMDLDGRLQQLVRAGLMPQNTLPLLRKAIAKVQGGMSLQGAERDVMATFINSMMYIVLGDDTIFNKARAGAKSYATEEIELDEADLNEDSRTPQEKVDHAIRNHRYDMMRSLSPADRAEKKEDHKAFLSYMKKKHPEVRIQEEVEKITELSDKTLKSYAKKAMDQATSAHGYQKDAEREGDRERARREMMHKWKRQTGARNAIDRIGNNTLAKEDFELSEENKYSVHKGKEGWYVNQHTDNGVWNHSVQTGYHPTKSKAVAWAKKHAGARPHKIEVKEEVENIDELSRATVGRYSMKAKSIADNEGGKDRTKGRELAGRKKWGGTMSGVKPARVPATEEVEQVDEISKATMGRYINKAKDSIDTNSWRQGYKEAGTGSPSGRLERKLSKRHKGIETAVKKLTKESRKSEALADISAVKQMNESYRTTFNAALETYGIKSPSELDEEKRKEFFNFVDQNYKKGDN